MKTQRPRRAVEVLHRDDADQFKAQNPPKIVWDAKRRRSNFVVYIAAGLALWVGSVVYVVWKHLK